MSTDKNVGFFSSLMKFFKRHDQQAEDNFLSEETKMLAKMHEQFNLHLNGNLSINLDNAEARRRLVREMKKFDGFQVDGRH